MIRKHLSATGYFKKILNKNCIEILRNIEIITLINKNNINKYKDIIINKLKDITKLKSFISYLKQSIFKNGSFNI